MYVQLLNHSIVLCVEILNVKTILEQSTIDLNKVSGKVYPSNTVNQGNCKCA